MLTIERAKELLATTTTEEHLFLHAKNVAVAMGGLAKHFDEDADHWTAIGYLHDYDYEQYPEEHLQHARGILEAAGVEEEDIRNVLSHGWNRCCHEVEPTTNIQKSIFTVDSLTGLISAAAKMRPQGIMDLEVSSLKKKYKDKKFAAKIDREVIKEGCEMLNMDMAEVMDICIKGMRKYADELGIGPKE